MKIKARDLASAIKKVTTILKTELPKVVVKGSSESMNNAMFREYPLVTGLSIATFKPVRVQGKKTQQLTIARFNSTAPTLLEFGFSDPRGIKAFNAIEGKFTPEAEKRVFIPNWVSAKGFDDRFPSGWVTVGGKNTFWGKKENKWFTRSVYLAKGNLGNDIREQFAKHFK